MSKSSRRILFAVTALAAFVAALPAPLAAQDAKPLAGERFKNLQVLKDIPAEQLFPSMRFIASSLGVKCSYCHVRPFEKDEKETKAKARKMISMLLALNQGSFDGKRTVTCYTCHRGAAKPVGLPLILEPGEAVAAAAHEPSGAAKPAEALPSGDELAAKYAQALGGAAAIAGIKSRAARGSFEGEEARGEIEELYASPLRSLIVTRTPAASFSRGFDGASAWQTGPQRRIVPGDPAQARRNSDFLRFVDLKKTYTKLTTEAKTTVAGQPAYSVSAEFAGSALPDRLFFSAESGLLLRAVRFTDSPLGTNPEQTDFSDYREAGAGVKAPFVLRRSEPTESTVIRYQSIEWNAPADDARFQKPGEAPPKP